MTRVTVGSLRPSVQTSNRGTASEATQSQVNTGTADGVYVSPKTLAEKVEVITASGTDTYTCTYPGTLTTGRKFFVLFTNANTGPATLNGTAIKKSVSTSLSSGDIAAGEIKVLAYDGTNLQIVGGSGFGGGDMLGANNLSDVASSTTSRNNLDVMHDRVTVTDKSTGFAPRLTDFEGASLKTTPLFRCTADLTVTLDQDSTDSIPVGFTLYGMTMSGYTTTFAAGSSATLETSSGGTTVVASATENFVLWSATKRVANVWSVQNGRAPSGSFTEFALVATALTFTNMPSGAQEIAAGTTGRYRTKVDLTNFTSIRCCASVSVVGATNAGFYLEYSTDQSSWTTLGAASGGDIARIGDAIGASVSDWITIPAEAKADVWLRGMGVAGNGAADPVVGRVTAQVK